jgi:hypothetical protein
MGREVTVLRDKSEEARSSHPVNVDQQYAKPLPSPTSVLSHFEAKTKEVQGAYKLSEDFITQ